MPQRTISPRPSTATSGALAGDEQDLASTDELKVYKDEGEEDEQRASENLSEDKLGLVTETEEVIYFSCRK
jgi:N-terminal CTNNB1 binding